MKETEQLVALAQRYLMRNYRQQPVVLSRGEGVHLWDVEGRRYLDMTAGIAVCALGHSHPRLAAAITGQAHKLLHVSNLYYIEEQIRLAEALCTRSFAARAFFCNSGAEANEGALKLVRRYQHEVKKESDRDTVVAFDRSFHGRTIASLAVTGQPKYHEGLGSLFGPVKFLPFGDIAAVEAALSGKKVCAVIVEPIQAEGGIHRAPPGFLASLRDICNRTGTLLVFDEVQTGVGRTGTWFAYEQENCIPDVMTLAKGLGGGVAIGAVVATEDAARGLGADPPLPVPHASTFGGNPLACIAARTVLEVIEEESLLANVMQAGEYLQRGLAALAGRFPALVAAPPRGLGLLWGLDFGTYAVPAITRCRERGLLLSLAGGSVLRFAPALIVRREHLDQALLILAEVLEELGARAPAGKA